MTPPKHRLEAELEALLQTDPEIWRFLREGSLDGVWFWDLKSTSEEWMSPEFWRLLGVDPATKRHDPAEWQDLIFPEDLALALSNFEKHLADPTHAYDQVVRYRHADGGVVWVRCRGVAIRDAEGKPHRMLGAHNDLTPLIRAQEAVASERRQKEQAQSDRQAAQELTRQLWSYEQALSVDALFDDVRASATSEALAGLDDEAFRTISDMVRLAVSAPIAAFSVLDSEDGRLLFKGAVGAHADLPLGAEAPSDGSYCEQVVAWRSVLAIADAQADAAAPDGVLSSAPPGVGAYLGAPVFAPDHRIVGTLCAFDVKPRPWTDDHVAIIEQAARAASDQLAAQLALWTKDELQRRLFFSRSIYERWGRIVEESEQEIYIFDAKSLRFIRVNPSARRNLGYSVEQLSRMTPLDIKPRYDAAGFEKLIAPLRKGAAQFIEFETVHRRADGGEYPVAIRLELKKDGDQAQFVAFCRDVSDRVALRESRKTQRELRELNRQFEGILNHASNGIAALDDEGRIILANPAGRHILGGVSVATPFPWPENIHFLDPDSLQPIEARKDPIRRVLSGARLQGETHVMTRASDPEPRYVRVASTILGDADAPIRAVVVFDDVSTEELARRQAERSNRLDALGQLTGGIAHDFNNLLGSILNSIEVVALDQQTERGSRLLTNAIDTVKRGSALSNRLLSFARQTPAVAASRAVEDVFESMETLIRPTIESAISIELRAPAGSMHVFCDQSQLENAILNLVLNARDAILRSGRGDRIQISARGVQGALEEPEDDQDYGHFIAMGKEVERAADVERDDGKSHRYVEIAVTDNGPGMSLAVKRRAVDPFFTTKDSNSGAGLGLSMVYGFVQQAGGELRIYSEEGLGTSVRLLLPRGEIGGERETPSPKEPIAFGAGQSILVVEDEPSLLISLTEALQVLGYQTLQAESGVRALQILRDERPIDLLLTDIVMPGGVGGFDLAKLVRDMRPDCPIVYMSGYTGFSEGQMGEVAAPMIQKPCSLPELATALDKALKGGPSA